MAPRSSSHANLDSSSIVRLIGVCLSFPQDSIDAIVAGGADIDLVELRTLKPLDLETIGMSLRRTHKVGLTLG